MVSVTPIVRQKLSDQVFDRLKEMIVSGELVAGDAMPSERDLMERYDVGRPAVREALQTLATKGLITISHGERSRVNRLNATIAFDQVDEVAKMLLSSEPSNVEHLKELRKILENGTVQIAGSLCTPEDSVELRTLVEKQRDHIGDNERFIEADIAFHARIAKITGNPLLQAVTQAMLSWLREYYTPLLYWSGHEETTLQEHSKIVDLLESNDSDAAAQLMTDHLNRSDPLYTSAKK